MIGTYFPDFKTRKAPGIIAGAFLLFIYPILLIAEEPTLQLAQELFEEQNWTACRTECSRVLSTHPENSTAAMLKTMAELKCGIDSIERLISIADDSNTAPDIASKASYEAGVVFIQKHKYDQALIYLKKAFLSSKQKTYFLRSGCLLAGISRTHPEFFKTETALKSQLSTCSKLWTPEIRKECDEILRTTKTNTKGAVGRSIVWLYQTQISSAIGQRCSLYPSCSEYARLAFQQYGFLTGIAMYGDRAVREPDAVADYIEPRMINGVCKARDLIEDHDFWFKENKHD